MFKFFKRRQESSEDSDKSKEYLESARGAAHKVVSTQHEDLRLRSEQNQELSEYLADPENHTLLLSLELQYLSGYFEEYAQEYEFPTTPEERASLHIIDWLIHYRGYNLNDARGEAVSLRQMKDENDRLFESIAHRGREAFAGSERADFYDILRIITRDLKSDGQAEK